MNKQFITTREAAELLKLPYPTASYHVGKLWRKYGVSQKIGGRWRINVQKLKAMYPNLFGGSVPDDNSLAIERLLALDAVHHIKISGYNGQYWVVATIRGKEQSVIEDTVQECLEKLALIVTTTRAKKN